MEELKQKPLDVVKRPQIGHDHKIVCTKDKSNAWVRLELKCPQPQDENL